MLGPETQVRSQAGHYPSANGGGSERLVPVHGGVRGGLLWPAFGSQEVPSRYSWPDATEEAYLGTQRGCSSLAGVCSVVRGDRGELLAVDVAVADGVASGSCVCLARE